MIFKRLLVKLSTDCIFTFNDKFYKQIQGCTMGGPLSVTLSDIHMTRCENEVVRPLAPVFYRRYVDDIFNRRKRNTNDEIFDQLNQYHNNINLTIEKSPKMFLDTGLELRNGKYETKVYRKETKMPIHWNSKAPKQYKRNAVLGDLHRAKRISTDFENEIEIIRYKYKNAQYPYRFVASIIENFRKSQNEELEDSLIIPDYLFKENKPNILIEIPFCEKNEKKVKDFMKKFHAFTDNNFQLSVKWITKKIKSLFPLKDKLFHPSCKIYQGVCSCGVSYIGETERNVEVRWGEHNRPFGTTEPSRHIANNVNHVFNWTIVSNAPKEKRFRKNLEASYIALLRPVLNEQVAFNTLSLFRNGVT